MKKKYPVFYLFQIPIEILFYAIFVELAAKADVYLLGGGAVLDNGERAYPFFTMAVFVIATVMLAVAIVVSIVNFVRYTIKKHQKKKAAREAMSGTAE